MRLTIVGCSGSAPGPAGPASCYLIDADGTRIVLDLGNGASGPLQAVTPLNEIDAILLSHLHADHCLDMTSLSVLLLYGSQRLSRPIDVYGVQGTAERLALAYDPGATPQMFAGLFDFHLAESVSIGPVAVRTAPMNHPVPAVAFRLDHGGRSVVYTGDTGECPALVELARGADVLLCEAAWGGGSAPVPNLHMTGRGAGEHAAAAGVGRLLLTHIPPWIDAEAARAAAATVFSGPVELVAAGQVYDI